MGKEVDPRDVFGMKGPALFLATDDGRILGCRNLQSAELLVRAVRITVVNENHDAFLTEAPEPLPFREAPWSLIAQGEDATVFRENDIHHNVGDPGFPGGQEACRNAIRDGHPFRLTIAMYHAGEHTEVDVCGRLADNRRKTHLTIERHEVKGRG